jgi:microcystin-dependent protein
MPTFGAGSGVGVTYSTLLISFPDVNWFKRNVMSALNEMTLATSWTEHGDVAISFAVEESEKMLQSYIFMDFNPIPIGLIHPFGAVIAPLGYLLCDGSSYPTADYPELYAVIGATYGAVGVNFNVPNLIDRVPIGSGSTYTIADVGGETSHTLVTSEIPNHNHSASNPTVIDPTHSHAEITAIPTVITIGAGVPAPSAIPSVGVTAPALTGISVLAPAIGNTGGDGSHNNLQPYLAVPYIIYAGR